MRVLRFEHQSPLHSWEKSHSKILVSRSLTLKLYICLKYEFREVAEVTKKLSVLAGIANVCKVVYKTQRRMCTKFKGTKQILLRSIFTLFSDYGCLMHSAEM